jgi:hypothetical protein
MPTQQLTATQTQKFRAQRNTEKNKPANRHAIETPIQLRPACHLRSAVPHSAWRPGAGAGAPLQSVLGGVGVGGAFDRLA